MGVFNRIGANCKDCCPTCPPCPGNSKKRGWTTVPINGCQQCGDCITCPDFPTKVGFTATSGDPSKCPRCPQCSDNPCYIAAYPGSLCSPCLPTRFLVVVVGVEGCVCFDAGLPHTGFAMFEAIGSPDGAYCFDGLSLPAGPSVEQNLWDGSVCGPPSTIHDTGTGGFVTCGVSFGTTGVTVHVFVTGQLQPMFCGTITSTSCTGPWTVPNQLPGCSYELYSVDDIPAECGGTRFPSPTLIGGSGGIATVYACGC